MYLYFWYCSSSFLSAESAVSLPGCFIKESTSACKIQQRRDEPRHKFQKDVLHCYTTTIAAENLM